MQSGTVDVVRKLTWKLSDLPKPSVSWLEKTPRNRKENSWNLGEDHSRGALADLFPI